MIECLEAEVARYIPVQLIVGTKSQAKNWIKVHHSGYLNVQWAQVCRFAFLEDIAVDLTYGA